MKVTYNLHLESLKKKYISQLKLVVSGCIIVCVVATAVIVYAAFCKSPKKEFIVVQYLNNDTTKVDEYSAKKQNMNLSKLGDILFRNSPYPKPASERFKILIWKEGLTLERRHIYFFTSQRHNPFEKCSVDNCEITYDESELSNANAVVFFLQRFLGLEYLPNGTRSPSQRWIFLTDQSPFNTFRNRDENDWRNYSGVFNWSMSYKMESDVPVPYGRTVINSNESSEDVKMLIPNYEVKQRNILVAIKTSECGQKKKRVRYVEELQKHMDVDVYGKCAQNPEDLCSSTVREDCPQLNKYLFYLSFENSNCDEFMTENLFQLSYSKGAVPIIMGPSVENCETTLPPNSYIHTKNFTPSELAQHLLNLNDTWNEELFDLHEWRKRYAVLNEHGYYGGRSFHYCRVCEALNYNDGGSKSYESLSEYLSVEDNCGDRR